MLLGHVSYEHIRICKWDTSIRRRLLLQLKIDLRFRMKRIETHVDRVNLIYLEVHSTPSLVVPYERRLDKTILSQYIDLVVSRNRPRITFGWSATVDRQRLLLILLAHLHR